MCDIGYIIRDHVPALMQVLTNELREYNMELMTTKCLNTAVMMMYLMLGARALEYTRQCDVRAVRGRVREGGEPASAAVARSLADEALSKPAAGTRELFYVMITDGCMPPVAAASAAAAAGAQAQPAQPAQGQGQAQAQGQAQGQKGGGSRRGGSKGATGGSKGSSSAAAAAARLACRACAQRQCQRLLRGPMRGPMRGGGGAEARCAGREFPGHVFVIEKLERGTYNLYQSYIKHYDLGGHIARSGSLSVGRERMRALLEGLARLVGHAAWDRADSELWMALTNTPAEHARQFEGHGVAGHIFLCYRRVQTDACLSQLRALVDAQLAKLWQVPRDRMAQLYGDPAFYSARNPDQRPLTNHEMLAQLTALRHKL